MKSITPYVKYGYVLHYYWSASKQAVTHKHIRMSEHPTFAGWAKRKSAVCLFCGSAELEHVGVVEFLTPFNDFIIYNKCLACACKSYPKPILNGGVPEAAWEYFPHLPMEEISRLALPADYWGRNWHNKARLLVEYKHKHKRRLREKEHEREKIFKSYGIGGRGLKK